MSARSLGRVYTFWQVPPDCLMFQIQWQFVFFIVFDIALMLVYILLLLQ